MLAGPLLSEPFRPATPLSNRPCLHVLRCRHSNDSLKAGGALRREREREKNNDWKCDYFWDFLRAQRSAVAALPRTSPRTHRSSSLFSEMLTAGLYLELLSIKREGGDLHPWRGGGGGGGGVRSGGGGSCKTEKVSSACFQEPLHPTRPPVMVFPSEDYSSPDCALMSVEFVFFLERTSSSRRRQTLRLEVCCCCCDVAGPQRWWRNVSGAG